jgi:wobble nucleotide-excising tRNase
MREQTKMINEVITKVKYELNATWLSFDIQEALEGENYESVAKLSSELARQSKAVVRITEKYADNKVAKELYELIIKRNHHMIDRVDVRFVKNTYGYVL